MEFKRWDLPIRVLIAVALGLGLLAFVFAGHKASDISASDKFVGLCLAMVYGFILFYLFGWPFLQRVGEKVGTIYTGRNENFRIVPEYSVAEARVNAGKYAEAIDEYRDVISKYPEDIYPHLRIADIALKHLQDPKTAELDLMSALSKAKGEDSMALAAGRLADIYQFTLHDPARALEVMKQLRVKIPGTKQAKLAEERIAILERIVLQGETAPEPPQKIASKPSRFKMTE